MNNSNENLSLGLYSNSEFDTEMRSQKKNQPQNVYAALIRHHSVKICLLLRKCYVGITYFYKHKHFEVEYKT